MDVLRADLIGTYQVCQAARNGESSDLFMQIYLLDRLPPFNCTGAAVCLCVIRQDVGNIRTFCRFKICQIARNSTRRINAYQDIVQRDLVGLNALDTPGFRDAFCAESGRKWFSEQDKNVSGLDGHCQAGYTDHIVIHFRCYRFRHTYNAICKFIGVRVIIIDHISGDHRLRVRQHGCRLDGSQGSLGQEAAIYQRKPAAIHRRLNIIRIGDIRGVGIGVCTVVKLETQAVIQRVRRKLAGRGLLRLKCRARLQIDHTELHRHQQVAVS